MNNATAKRMTSTARPAGFTLIELIVALVIGSAILLALAGTVRVAFKARQSALDATQDVRARGALADLLRADLELAQPPSGVLADAFVGLDSSLDGRDADELWFFAASGARDRRRLFDDEPLVDSETVQVFRGDRPSRATDVQEVVYRLASDPTDEDSLVLTRAVRFAAVREVEEVAVGQIVARGVERFDVRYFDGVDWFDHWDAALEENELPVAVELIVELAGRRGGPMVIVVALPMALVDDGTGTRVVR